MSIILWIVFGGLIGWIASIIMRTDAEQGMIMNIALGIVGGVVGGWIMKAFDRPGITGFDIYSFVVALLGAIILISIGRIFRRQRT